MSPARWREILLIEDDQVLCGVLRAALRREGYLVEVLHGGAAACEYMERRPPPALVLLDLLLPEINGVELLADMRRGGGPWSRVAVIAMSGSGTVLQAAQALGVSECLRKPINLQVLLGRIEHHVRAGAASGAEQRRCVRVLVPEEPPVTVRLPWASGILRLVVEDLSVRTSGHRGGMLLRAGRPPSVELAAGIELSAALELPGEQTFVPLRVTLARLLSAGPAAPLRLGIQYQAEDHEERLQRFWNRCLELEARRT